MYFYYYEIRWNYDDDYAYTGIVAAENYSAAMRQIEREFQDGEILECNLRFVAGGENGMMCFNEAHKDEVLKFVTLADLHAS